MPSLTGVVETAIYVEDIERASKFYEQVIGLDRIAGDDRFRAYNVAGKDVLLLFKRGATAKPVHTPSGVIPPTTALVKITSPSLFRRQSCLLGKNN